MAENQRMRIGGFVIMPNHVHLLFRVGENHLLKNVQRDFLKYTAQQIKFDLQQNHPQVLEHFVSSQNDRSYQIWERRPLAIPLYSREVMYQKLLYIHNNPCQERWKLADDMLDYHFSSCGFYENGKTEFPFLMNYMDI